MSYASETGAFDAEVLDIINAWHRRNLALDDDAFGDLALRLFAYQRRWNDPYARYCASLGVSSDSMPSSWRTIPAVPTTAYKDATLATFDPASAALAFETSGTTRGVGGRHYMETTALYDAALLAGFDRFILNDGARMRYLNVVPNPADAPQSSLGYMMAKVAAERGDGHTGWYVRGEDLFFEAFVLDCRAAISDRTPTCITGTAFAFVQICDRLAERGLRLPLPPRSRIVETGGFKGRSRIVARADLYAALSRHFDVAQDVVVAEYGMTELTSQWYDAPPRVQTPRVKQAPPWLRARVVGADGRELPNGVVGALVHVDLANRSSCIAVQTDDLGAMTQDGLVLIGRDESADLRGCSLDAEMLRSR